MSEWKEYKLEDLADITPGFAFKSNEFGELGEYVAKIKDINPPFVDIRNAEKVDIGIYPEHKLDKYKLDFGDYIIAMTGATIGKIGRLKECKTIYINQRVAKIKAKKGVNNDFIYYSILTEDFQSFIQNNIDSNSAQENISGTSIGRFSIHLPSLPEQKSIASILSSLDDKIDLLHRQNATLEKMAETLFRQWFVEEAKDEWEEIRLGSIVEVINGVSYKSDDLNSSKIAMVTLKNFDRNGGFRMDGYKEYTGKYKEQHILKEGDLVVAHTDITQEADVIGNPVMAIGSSKYDTMVFSMDLVKVISKDENYSNEFLYLIMKSNEFKEHCLGYSNGSTVLHLSKKAVPEYEMKLPPYNLINDFSKMVKPLVEKQFKNQTQISTLTTLRDTLLPKLMSGEVRVEPD